MMLLIILLVIVCLILALFVLIQNPKGGGLATGNSGTSMFGVQRTGDVLEKGSWVLIALIVVLSLSITTMAKSGSGTATHRLQNRVDKMVTPASGMGTGQAAPANQAPATQTTTTAADSAN